MGFWEGRADGWWGAGHLSSELSLQLLCSRAPSGEAPAPCGPLMAPPSPNSGRVKPLRRPRATAGWAGTRPGNPQAATASATPREDNSTSTRHHHTTAPSTPRRGDDDDDDGTAPTPSGRTHTATLSPSYSSNGDRTAGPVQSPARVADCRPPLSSVAATPPPPRLAHHGPECIYAKSWLPPPQPARPTSASSASAAAAASTSTAAAAPTQQPSAVSASSDDAKLVFGTVFSLRNMVRKLGGDDDAFISYRTGQYKLHFYETPANLRFVLLTDTGSASMRNVLHQIYINLWVEYVVKNPLAPVEHKGGAGVKNELFELGVDQFIRGLM
ncbi:transport protein particle complex of the golgi, subunit bet5-like protein [Purpureocillium lilacinum]|uniref:Transport protein particle complex of the golgi, subunit bet5-like protein n=1 Tax=Purpureocillium lilacinum TaxID=33203 RepID=A0A2U3EJ90_PURLI|nr:transport protein particle complex of the golgi, subunit bet5-like protein [Purpureocillium lilacinum]